MRRGACVAMSATVGRVVGGREADERAERRRRERTRDVEQKREASAPRGAATISARGTGRAVTS